MFWLSHHFENELNRCYRFGSVHVCARCLGTYPTLLIVFVAQFLVRAPLEWAFDTAAGLALLLPATLDWASGRFRPQRGSNAQRTLTGILLGVSLGRSLFIHVQRPFPPVLIAQLVAVTVVAVPVILATYRRQSGR